jgi:tetratricopeptide (TPR) repeat protein
MQENEYALNCYKQALKLNKNHKASIFNLACAYEKLKDYSAALEWFYHAIKVEEDWPDAHYGLALCCLKLKKNQEAVHHIENATKWSIEEYKTKMKKRKRREELRRIELQEAIAKGNANPKANKDVDGESESKEVLCPEDDDSQDELYIDPATKKNEGVSTHIMYVRALCHREVKNYKMSLESYAKVMKREHEISDYEKMIEQQNFKDLALKIVEGPGFPGWRIDIYSHFKRNKLLKENNRIMMVDLTKYYVRKEGWLIDRIPEVIVDLQRIRFFNRFDRETLYQMMKKTDLRVVSKRSLLFLEPDQCAIVVNGNLNMFSHKNDVAVPILQAVFTPGDIIGNAAIDKGWSRDTHSWIIAYQDCDILVMNIEYVNYLWDKMKQSSKKNYIAEKIKDRPWFKNMSE